MDTGVCSAFTRRKDEELLLAAIALQKVHGVNGYCVAADVVVVVEVHCCLLVKKI
jgi:hypothetical protein